MINYNYQINYGKVTQQLLIEQLAQNKSIIRYETL